MTVDVLFAPEGHVSSIYVNGESLPNGYCHAPARLYLLLARAENAPLTTTDSSNQLRSFDADAKLDFSGNPDDGQISDIRQNVNWLNPDSRWLSIDVRRGRITTSENAVFNPTQFAQNGESVEQQVAYQIRYARQFAREMKQEGGR